MQAGGRRFESDYLHHRRRGLRIVRDGDFFDRRLSLAPSLLLPKPDPLALGSGFVSENVGPCFSRSIHLFWVFAGRSPAPFILSSGPPEKFFKKSFTSAGKCAILLRQPKGRKEGKGLLSCFLSFGRMSVGAYDGEGPPVPIPNTEVKLIGGDNTCLATDREDSTVPTQMFLNSSVGRARGC